VDIILQSIGRDGTKDITFTVSLEDGPTAIEVLEEHKPILNYSSLVWDENVSKVSIVGAGMESNPGVAAKMFEALSEANINIQMISTSEIKISVLVEKPYSKAAVLAIHEAFDV
jgi:aspartate kinase